MEITDDLQFDDQDRKDLYDYVESHGSVREAEVRRALNMDPTAFGHHLTILRREGYLRKVGSTLRVAYQREHSEVREVDGLAVTIRTAEEEDRDALIEAVRTVAEEGTYIEAETVADALDYEGALLRHNDVKSRLFFVAEVSGAQRAPESTSEEQSDSRVETDDGSDLVGWVHLDLPEAEKLSHTAVLTVGLVPEYRGRGIGHVLLDRGVSWAREHGFEKLYNSVPSTNERAIDFLEAQGWEVEAVREDHYKIGGDHADEVMMAVDLRDGKFDFDDG